MASEIPTPQVVRVVMRDGDSELRRVELDRAAGKLILWQVPDGDLELDQQSVGQAAVKLESIAHVAASGKIAKLRGGGASGPVLLELHFASDSVAQAWASAIQSSKSNVPKAGGSTRTSPLASPKGSTSSGRSPAGGKGAPTARGRGTPAQAEADASATKTLRELCKQQTEQVRLLEEITKRKNEQLLKMQQRLEEALSMLQVGQTTYAKQQVVLDEQQQMVDHLQDQLRAAVSIQATCSANAAEASAGFAAAKAARSKREGVGESSQGGKESAARAAASAVASPPAARSSPMEEGGEGTSAEERALLEKLRFLESEKGQFEAQLRSEQGQIFAQLQELHDMMAELGIDGLGPLAAEA